MDSPYFDPIKWRLLPGAPADIVEEFTAYEAAEQEETAAPEYKPEA
jgi:hypothetical protein